MPRRKIEGTTRQIYASVREEVYLAAKARAAELRVPLRELIEMALENMLAGPGQPLPSADPARPRTRSSIWDDEYLRMQTEQPVGSPVELSREEAAKVALGDLEAE